MTGDRGRAKLPGGSRTIRSLPEVCASEGPPAPRALSPGSTIGRPQKIHPHQLTQTGGSRHYIVFPASDSTYNFCCGGVEFCSLCDRFEAFEWLPNSAAVVWAES